MCNLSNFWMVKASTGHDIILNDVIFFLVNVSMLDFPCIYSSIIFYPDVCCCCNVMMLDNWCECLVSVFGSTKHCLCNCIDTWQ